LIGNERAFWFIELIGNGLKGFAYPGFV